VVTEAVVAALSDALGEPLTDPALGFVEELVSVVVMAVANSIISAIVLIILAIGGGGGVATVLTSKFDRNLRSAAGNSTETDTAQVKEETVSTIITAIVSAVVSAISGAVVQASIQSILGILGIAPGSDGPAERGGNRTFTKADLNALTASLNDTLSTVTNETITTNFVKVVSAGPEALISTVTGATLDAFFELLASPDGDLSLNGILSQLDLGHSIAVVGKTNVPAIMLTKKSSGFG
jgi:hypothetical protein